MKSIVTKILAMLLTVAFITGCSSMTKEEATASAKVAFEAGATAAPQQPNHETELFSYFLPPVLIVEETNENNLILSRGNQLYLIFSNSAEDTFSKINYELDKDIEENPIMIETLENEETFSYLIVSPFGDDEFKVIVGSGGEKGTTITGLQNIEDSVEIILQIINSVSY